MPLSFYRTYLGRYAWKPFEVKFFFDKLLEEKVLKLTDRVCVFKEAF